VGVIPLDGAQSLRAAAEARGWTIPPPGSNGGSPVAGRKRVTSPEGVTMDLHASDLWAELYARELVGAWAK